MAVTRFRCLLWLLVLATGLWSAVDAVHWPLGYPEPEPEPPRLLLVEAPPASSESESDEDEDDSLETIRMYNPAADTSSSNASPIFPIGPYPDYFDKKKGQASGDRRNEPIVWDQLFD
ncbi:uncharacterized protein LOC126981423 [Eriocheir sinensis]|uniref:uncharacterized protein LOC126981423 n=1 Tax=Eriocheir sinensis TaxID=95602 RepID=UPI0021C574D9|nr:uncharacterized protein LOC126981423 [Eriocheir sinensis]